MRFFHKQGPDFSCSFATLPLCAYLFEFYNIAHSNSPRLQISASRIFFKLRDYSVYIPRSDWSIVLKWTPNNFRTSSKATKAETIPDAPQIPSRTVPLRHRLRAQIDRLVPVWLLFLLRPPKPLHPNSKSPSGDSANTKCNFQLKIILNKIFLLSVEAILDDLRI